MTWYISNLARYKSERLGLELLGSAADWCEPVGWRIDDRLRLTFDANVVVGQRVYPVFLKFPEQFPHTPPSVWPRGETTRWSIHQFGAGGELCTEFGPDNWTSDMTATQMLESAYRLLAGENPPSGEEGTVASRHEDSLGQRLRSKTVRLLVTRDFSAMADGISVGTTVHGNLVTCFRKPGASTYLVDRVTLPDQSIWQDPSVPDTLGYETYERPIAIVRMSANASLPSSSNYDQFVAACVELGLSSDEPFVIVLRGSDIAGYIAAPSDKSVYSFAVIPPEERKQRLDEAHQSLAERTVGIVGCGSVGSKVATTLARSGVRRFVIVDSDILMPDNMVRHDLDWRDIGAHKADALARRLKNVRPDVQITIHNVKLAGQESGGTADAVLTNLAGCDLVVDATADPEVLNLLSAVAADAGKSILWAKVFGGGVGGVIARCRPGVEPPPQLARRAIENWFREQNTTTIEPTADYGARRGDGDPFIADDADVTAIAAPAARLAIDTLLGRAPSHFSHSAYAIGLAPGLVFTQAFETYPIELGLPPEKPDIPTLSTEEINEEVATIIKLLPSR